MENSVPAATDLAKLAMSRRQSTPQSPTPFLVLIVEGEMCSVGASALGAGRREKLRMTTETGTSHMSL
jgi:hypothetical protein